MAKNCILLLFLAVSCYIIFLFSQGGDTMLDMFKERKKKEYPFVLTLKKGQKPAKMSREQFEADKASIAKYLVKNK